MIEGFQLVVLFGVPQNEELRSLRLLYNDGYLPFDTPSSHSFNDCLLVLRTNAKPDLFKLKLSFHPEFAHPHIAFVPEEKVLLVYREACEPVSEACV